MGPVAASLKLKTLNDSPYNIYEQKEIQPAIYRCILPISEGIAAVVDDSNKVGFVDIHGNLIVDGRYDNPYPEKLEKPQDLLHLLKKQDYFGSPAKFRV